MTLPSNGITPEIIREMMPPYHLDTDLLAATITALPRPPANASPAWRQARLARLVREIAGLMPADAPQARVASAILIAREAADDTYARAAAPGLTGEQVCRLRRTAADLERTAMSLERGLARRQAKPAPFFGTVLAEGVDLAALDAVWCEGGLSGDAAAGAGWQADGPGLGGRGGDAPEGRGAPAGGPGTAGVAGSMPGSDSGTGEAIGADDDSYAATEDELGVGSVDVDAALGRGVAVAGGEIGDGPAAADVQEELGGGPAGPGRDSFRRPHATMGRPAAAGAGPNAAPDWEVSRLDQGPGWTLEVVRPRRGGDAGVGAAPEAAPEAAS